MVDVTFKVLRQSGGDTPTWQSYRLSVQSSTTILDSLNRIKWEQDGTLAFRKNCRNTICGSCSMRINGRSALACKENVGQELNRFSDQAAPEITIEPLGNLPVIRDLVVDMKPFWKNLKAVDPYISTAARAVPEREFLQTPEARQKLDQTGNCIMCGACYSECNSVAVNPDFVGPHALAKAYRMVADNRDDATVSRLSQYNSDAGVWGCTRCNQCNQVCPMEVAPLDQISRIKQGILAREDESSSRAIRHRKQLVALVKQGGWIDERKFGFNVVADRLRDVSGLASLVPLGLRMLRKGKLPLAFEPSDGTTEVRSLIDAVQAFEAKSMQSTDSDS
ncbi:succinate dehydrogenase/fumarate reductase iron-sulfur subunit [filamentous cyanobacterium LEGE 11480]|uniref:Fumarate reductase iron-sulfur subunit n=1 Tax=Romeriopsis navalis LEGE 11480 TaxID=2777977 RepID=A0A928VMB5_9CYAN|nr:succinate dehydrogenase/fumarate reductase iron-sulfur subunit [Romeriopsis navalis]MBE9030945.1 succinate dehydrogenase/fumarate reductase iron-sulfur subunit [Romeriopsis navalis LEGE 11480]